MKAKNILISGLGIAGPTLAFWLKAAGFVPTLVEHAPTLRRGGYVIDFWGTGLDIAERMGLTGEINRIGYHMRGLQIVDARGRRVAGLGTTVLNELTGGRFVTLARSDLSRLLFKLIEPSCEVLLGDEIVALGPASDGLDVELARAGQRHFDLLIGADGLHSNVRRLVFGPQHMFEKELGYMAAAFEVCGYRPRSEDFYITYNEPGRMLGRVALHEDRTLFLFVFACDPHGSPPLADLGEQKAILRETYGSAGWECGRILDELDSTQSLYFDRVSQIRMNSWSRGKVALVGDAAFCVSLMAGQGSALAMTAAYVLAGELARASGRPEAAFPSYEAILRPFIERKQRAAQRFADVFAPKTRWGLWVRNLVVNASAIPGLARMSFGGDIIDSVEIPDYVWPPVGVSG